MLLAFMFAGTIMVSCQKEDDPNWVDLDLPSGALWARCNLGASSPEKYGLYLAWGETETKSVYTWGTYRYCTVNDEGDPVVFQNQIASSSTLLPAYDAATVVFGAQTHTPTHDEWKELLNNTTYEWTVVNGVGGLKFTASNGNSIFLPAAGMRSDSEVMGEGSRGYYWTSTLAHDIPAWGFNFSSSNHSLNFFGRYFGHSIRPVRKPKE